MTTIPEGFEHWADDPMQLVTLGVLLDAIDTAGEGDSTDDEFDAYRAALDEAIDQLTRLGFLIPRAADNNPGCSCGNADYGAPGHDGGPELTL